jgi:hypothetical protein
MLCDPLIAFEREVRARGIEETYRGQPWTRNCREWVYFACCFDLAALRARFAFAPCVCAAAAPRNLDQRAGICRCVLG